MIVMMMTTLLLLPPQHPRPEVPPTGSGVEQTLEIILPTTLPGPVVTIAARGARIAVSRALLEQCAALDGPRWATEEERQTQIAAGRAKRLLDKAGPPRLDPETAIPADALDDAAHLVAQVLEAGKALVIPDGSVGPVGSITVRYFGTHPAPTVGFGRIVFSLPPPAGEFFSVPWFSS